MLKPQKNSGMNVFIGSIANLSIL